jgi:hypothetical protein
VRFIPQRREKAWQVAPEPRSTRLPQVLTGFQASLGFLIAGRYERPASPVGGGKRSSVTTQLTLQPPCCIILENELQYDANETREDEMDGPPGVIDDVGEWRAPREQLKSGIARTGDHIEILPLSAIEPGCNILNPLFQALAINRPIRRSPFEGPKAANKLIQLGREIDFDNPYAVRINVFVVRWAAFSVVF